MTNTHVDFGATVSEALRHELLLLLPAGREAAIPGSRLAAELGISERLVRALVQDLIELDDWLVGSICSGDRAGYFLVADEADLEAGTAHLVSRARSLFARVSKLRALARERFSEPTVLRLFELDEPKQEAKS